MDASAIKAELKSWEHDFQLKFNKKPTLQDIRHDPIVSKYKLHRQLSQPSTKPSALPFKSFPMPSEDTSPSSGNPFASPKKSRLPPFMSNEQTPPHPISKARKRLHGEPVSPSPSKDTKKRRLLKDWRQGVTQSSVTHYDATTANSGVLESPVKASSRSFLPLFQENSINGNHFEGLAPTSNHHPNWTDLRTLSRQHPVNSPDGAQKESTFELVMSSLQQPTSLERQYEDSESKSRVELSFDLQVNVTEWRAPQKRQQISSRTSVDGNWFEESVAKGLMKGAKPPERDLNDIEVRLSSELSQALSFRDSWKEMVSRGSNADQLTGNLLFGKNFGAVKGIRSWAAGELDNEEQRRSSEDEWSENGQEWTGEL